MFRVLLCMRKHLSLSCYGVKEHGLCHFVKISCLLLCWIKNPSIRDRYQCKNGSLLSLTSSCPFSTSLWKHTLEMKALGVGLFLITKHTPTYAYMNAHTHSHTYISNRIHGIFFRSKENWSSAVGWRVCAFLFNLTFHRGHSLTLSLFVCVRVWGFVIVIFKCYIVYHVSAYVI